MRRATCPCDGRRPRAAAALLAACVAAALFAPASARATCTVTPTTSTTGSYTVSWTESSSPSYVLFLGESVNGGAFTFTQIPYVSPPTMSRTFAGKPSGSYAYQVRVLWMPYVRLLAESNVATVTVTPRELTVSGVSGTPTTLRAGDTMAVSSIVSSSGPATDVGFWVRYYLSTDASITTSDVSIGATWIPALGANGSFVSSASAVVPTTAGAGIYYLGAIVDADGAVPESNEGNNAFTAHQVTVNTVRVDPTVSTNGAYTVSWTEQGSGSFPIWLGESFNGGAWTFYAVPAPPAQSLAFSGKTSGTYAYKIRRVMMPQWSTVYESNVESVTVQVPDLTVTALSGMPPSAGVGERASLSSTVTSSGAPAPAFWVEFYLSSDAVITTADALLGSRWVPGLAAGEHSTASSDVTVPAVPWTGRYYVGAIVDPDGAVAEQNEANNGYVAAGQIDVRTLQVIPPVSSDGSYTVTWTETGSPNYLLMLGESVGDGPWSWWQVPLSSPPVLSRTYAGREDGSYSYKLRLLMLPQAALAYESNVAVATVALPDLTVSGGVTLDASGGLVATSTVTSAHGPTPIGTWLRLYVSTDANVTRGDTEVGASPVPPLAAGATATVTTAITLPSGLTGALFLGAIADADDQVRESDELNNRALLADLSCASGTCSATPPHTVTSRICYDARGNVSRIAPCDAAEACAAACP